MNVFRFPDDTIWEPTGEIVVYNYPPNPPKTMTYLCRKYKEIVRGKHGHTIVEGSPVYLDSLTAEQQALVTTMATAHNVLAQTIRFDNELERFSQKK